MISKKRIGLFSNYSQSENRTTNYCLLLLKLLYEEHPRHLAMVLETLLGADVSDQIGVQFFQQERKASSVPDGVIIQKPVTIYVETKNFDWFYDAQLEQHLAALDEEQTGMKVLIALGYFESKQKNRFVQIEAICRENYQSRIRFTAMSFEDFINAFEMPQLSGAISDMVADFRAYLDENELLPNWRNQLDVANCGALPEDILEGKAYMCPATGGAYSHKRCQYFGMYRNKRVEIVAEIQAVIDVFSDSETEIKWVNTTHLQDLETRAIKTVQQYRSDTFPIRVFLLGELYPLDFIKDTKGAMQSSKQYFDVSSLKITDAKALARALDKKNWSDLGFVRN